MINLLANVKCGGENGIVIDSIVPNTISLFVNILKIAVPIILIIYGMLDLAKAVMANEEKEMKEAQKKLIKRIIYAIVIFFVVALVQFVFGRLAKADADGNGSNAGNATGCISCFINGNCDRA